MGLIDQETSPASPTLYLEVQEGIPNSNPKYTRNTVAQVLQNLGSEKKNDPKWPCGHCFMELISPPEVVGGSPVDLDPANLPSLSVG